MPRRSEPWWKVVTLFGADQFREKKKSGISGWIKKKCGNGQGWTLNLQAHSRCTQSFQAPTNCAILASESLHPAPLKYANSIFWCNLQKLDPCLNWREKIKISVIYCKYIESINILKFWTKCAAINAVPTKALRTWEFWEHTFWLCENVIYCRYFGEFTKPYGAGVYCDGY